MLKIDSKYIEKRVNLKSIHLDLIHPHYLTIDQRVTLKPIEHAAELPTYSTPIHLQIE